MSFPFNLVSGTVKQGYNKVVHDNYKSNAILVNLHSDTTYNTNDIPMQGPFAETHVGGIQSRHQPINKYDSEKSTTNNIDDVHTRAESYRLVFETTSSANDGAFAMLGHDYGGPYPDPLRPPATMFRNVKIKRPVNLQNIQHNTSSNRAGNFNKNYEVVMAVGRSENNLRYRSIVDRVDFIVPEFTASMPSTNVNGALVARKVSGEPALNIGNTFLSSIEPQNFTSSIQKRSSNFYTPELRLFADPLQSTDDDNNPTKSIITQKFSAPGGPETMSPLFLDAIASEKVLITLYHLEI